MRSGVRFERHKILGRSRGFQILAALAQRALSEDSSLLRTLHNRQNFKLGGEGDVQDHMYQPD